MELLAQLGVVPDAVRAPDVDETPSKGELPRAYCRRVTRAKVEVTKVGDGEIALCADTTVALGRRILGKPADVTEARDFLTLLSGRRHRVITAIAVKAKGHIWLKDVVSTVQLKRLSEAELNGYLSSKDWVGKAGGYGIQGPAGAFVTWISGSYSAIVGLPLHETAMLLQAAGYAIDARPA